MNVGLRIDVDTFRGTRDGLPALCELLKRESIRASIFVCVGPDNMGRHLLRLFRPRFLAKMLRSKAASLYGWDILFRGLLWPGPVIGRKLADRIRRAADDGHEVGLHAWDHHRWQCSGKIADRGRVTQWLERGFEALERILGRAPTCSAAPAWKCTDAVLLAKAEFPFRHNSDCRGSSIFRPVVNGTTLDQPQIPVTLPTYDEMIGSEGVADENYNQRLLGLVRPDGLNVLTIHAEVEGIARAGLFEAFLAEAKRRGIGFVPLCDLLPGDGSIPAGRIERGSVPGRDGWVAYQCRMTNVESKRIQNTGDRIQNEGEGHASV